MGRWREDAERCRESWYHEVCLLMLYQAASRVVVRLKCIKTVLVGRDA